MVNTSQQVGGSIGTALLNTLAASATTAWARDHIHSAADQKNLRLVNEAAVHGYSVAIYWAMAILVLASGLAFTLINAGVQNTGERVEGDESVEDLAVPVDRALIRPTIVPSDERSIR